MGLRSSSNGASSAQARAPVVWKGTAPSGYSVVIARDERQRWVATVAGAARSRNVSLEAALLEAGGTMVERSWVARLATAVITQSGQSPGDSRVRVLDQAIHRALDA